MEYFQFNTFWAIRFSCILLLPIFIFSCVEVEKETQEIREYPFGISQYLPPTKTAEYTYIAGLNEWPLKFEMYYLGTASSKIGDLPALNSKHVQAKYSDINNGGFEIRTMINAAGQDTVETIMILASNTYCMDENYPNTLSYGRQKKALINTLLPEELYQTLKLTNWKRDELFLSTKGNFIFAKGGIIAFEKCNEWYVLKAHDDLH